MPFFFFFPFQPSIEITLIGTDTIISQSSNSQYFETILFFWKNFSLLSSLLSLSPSRSRFFFFLFLSVFLLGRFPCYHVGSKVVTSHYYCSYYKSAINLLKPAENNSLSNSKCGKYTYGYSNNLGYLKRVLLPPPQIVPIRRHLMGWLSNLISLMSQVAQTKWLFGDQLLLQDLDSW